MDTVMDILTTYNPKMKFENFLEEDALTSIMIGVMQSLILLTPLDPDEVAKHGLQIIDIVCNIAVTTEHRLLALWIFELLFQLLRVLGSNVEYRMKVPKILSTCSAFLSSTRSRKARMAILKVLGAIGCLEVDYQSDSIVNTISNLNLIEFTIWPTQDIYDEIAPVYVIKELIDFVYIYSKNRFSYMNTMYQIKSEYNFSCIF